MRNIQQRMASTAVLIKKQKEEKSISKLVTCTVKGGSWT
jgi:hypothetical protein